MARVLEIMGAGLPAATASAINLGQVAAALTAAGSTQGTALALDSVSSIHLVTTAAASTGVRLPAVGAPSVAGDTLFIRNDGANALTVYPATGEFINALAVNTGKSLAAGSMAICTRYSATTWIMGVLT